MSCRKHIEGDYGLDSYTLSGDSILEKRFAIRCMAATWCLACFVFVQSYSSVLTSVLTLPVTPKPLIHSIYDIQKVKGLNVVVVRKFPADLVLSVNPHHDLCGTVLD